MVAECRNRTDLEMIMSHLQILTCHLLYKEKCKKCIGGVYISQLRLPIYSWKDYFIFQGGGIFTVFTNRPHVPSPTNAADPTLSVSYIFIIKENLKKVKLLKLFQDPFVYLCQKPS